MRLKASSSGATHKARVLATLLILASAEALAQTSNVRPSPRREVVVTIPARKLAVVEEGRVLKVCRVAVGAANSPSPAGEYKIINRLTNPGYYHKGTVIAPGPANPLGTRWLGLSRKGYGIHGTNEPRSIGKAASHGCIRMAKADLEQIFEMLQIGDSVVVRDDIDEQTAEIFGEPQNSVVAQASSPATSDGQ